MATAKGNVYVDDAFTSQAAIDEKFGGVSPITGEQLIYGESLDDLDNGANAISAAKYDGNQRGVVLDGQKVIPVEGGTLFYSNHVFSGQSIYGNGQDNYTLYVKDVTANYLYGVPKTVDYYQNGYKVYEVKRLKYKMAKRMCEEEITKIKDINDLNVIEVGLICSSGFDFIRKT